MHLTLAFLMLVGNCSESYVGFDTVAKYAQPALAALKAGPNGAYFDRIEGERLYTTPAFDKAPAERKQAILEAGLMSLWEVMPQAERDNLRENSGAISNPTIIVDPIGRQLYRDTPCSSAYVSLTEHQRVTNAFSISYSYTQQDRPQTYRLKLDLQQVKKGFHGVMSWKPEYFINWVPEGGFFEIDVPDRAAVARLSKYWPKAPRGYRYDVRLNDGTLVDTVKR
jgi:hypothetical protein